ncbi:hypothetical protein ACVWWN_006329 [Mycobacterium sp. URHB0021]
MGKGHSGNQFMGHSGGRREFGGGTAAEGAMMYQWLIATSWEAPWNPAAPNR